MKTAQLLNIILACALLLLVIKLVVNSSKAPTITTTENQTLATIHARKSVRGYTDQPISKAQLDTLLRAGMAAPTAKNAQPWFFVVVDDRAILDTLANGLPYAKMLHKASVAIVVCGDKTKMLPNDEVSQLWVQDCSAATQNILLAAQAIGLGAVWTAAFPYADRMKAVTNSLKLPEHLVPLNVIPVGYPLHNEKPKEKYKTENIHWNQFQ